MIAVEQPRAFVGIGDRRGVAGEVGTHPVLEVEGELRVCEQVGVPLARAGQAREVDGSVDVVEPDLDPAGLGRERAPIVVMSTV